MRYIIYISLLGLLITASAIAGADTLASQRPSVQAALDLAEQGKLDDAGIARLQNHPLAGWIEAIALERQIHRISTDRIDAALKRLVDQPAGNWLRSAWLAHLARESDWARFRRFYIPADGLLMRCAELAARQTEGNINEQWFADAQAVWLTGSSLPNSCDSPLAALEGMGKLTSELRWQRIELAAEQGQSNLIRFIARKLSAADAKLANDYADFIDAPHPRATKWPDTSRSHLVTRVGLARLAKRNPDKAEAMLASIGNSLKLSESEAGQVRYQIALWTAASYEPQAAQRFAAVPAASYDARLHEWRTREALHRGDEKAALAAIDAMDASQRSEPRWQYLQARLYERAGDDQKAKSLYTTAATQAGFHGFLAADKIDAPYALCPLEPSADAATRKKIADAPEFIRAIELFRVQRAAYAAREWSALVKRLSDIERKVAVDLAVKARWYDRAVFGVGSDEQALRYYSLRFPLHHSKTLNREAKKNGLDAAWVAALTRAESAFMPNARSPADARGLMQLLPSTAERTAKSLGISWGGGSSLYNPRINFQLGTAYLRQMLDEHNGYPYRAIAAYNAGPTAVRRWLTERPQLDADLWIETIPYYETRDYVARVLAFSVIYDWRLNKQALPLTDRMLGRSTSSKRRQFRCPADGLAGDTPSSISTTSATKN